MHEQQFLLLLQSGLVYLPSSGQPKVSQAGSDTASGCSELHRHIDTKRVIIHAAEKRHRQSSTLRTVISISDCHA